jgi:hypothetical protein
MNTLRQYVVLVHPNKVAEVSHSVLSISPYRILVVRQLLKLVGPGQYRLGVRKVI